MRFLSTLVLYLIGCASQPIDRPVFQIIEPLEKLLKSTPEKTVPKIRLSVINGKMSVSILINKKEGHFFRSDSHDLVILRIPSPPNTNQVCFVEKHLFGVPENIFIFSAGPNFIEGLSSYFEIKIRYLPTTASV